MAVFLLFKEVNIMANRAEMISNYKQRLVRDLGIWEDDPRSMAAVEARTTRAAETINHMDKPLPQEIRTTNMKPEEAYKL